MQPATLSVMYGPINALIWVAEGKKYSARRNPNQRLRVHFISSLRLVAVHWNRFAAARGIGYGRLKYLGLNKYIIDNITQQIITMKGVFLWEPGLWIGSQFSTMLCFVAPLFVQHLAIGNFTFLSVSRWAFISATHNTQSWLQQGPINATDSSS